MLIGLMIMGGKISNEICSYHFHLSETDFLGRAKVILGLTIHSGRRAVFRLHTTAVSLLCPNGAISFWSKSLRQDNEKGKVIMPFRVRRSK